MAVFTLKSNALRGCAFLGSYERKYALIFTLVAKHSSRNINLHRCSDKQWYGERNTRNEAINVKNQCSYLIIQSI